MSVGWKQTSQIIPGVSFITAHVAYASTNKTKIIRTETEYFFLPGAYAPHVHVRAWTLCYFHSFVSTQTFRRALAEVSGQLRRDKECPFSGVTNYGRIWRKVPESNVQSVGQTLTD